MNEPITTIEFNKLLHMAVDKYNLDLSNTYVEFTWWDNGMFRPFICTDCDRKKNSSYLCSGIIFAMSSRRMKMDMSFQLDSIYGKRQSP